MQNTQLNADGSTDWHERVAQLRQATSQQKKVERHLFVELCDALLQIRAPAAQLEEALRAAVFANPGDLELLARWESCAITDKTRRQEQLVELQAAAPKLVRSIVIELTKLAGPTLVFSLFSDRINTFKQSRTTRALERLWAAHTSGSIIEEDDARGTIASDAKLYFSLEAHGRKTIQVTGRTKPNRVFEQCKEADPELVCSLRKSLTGMTNDWRHYIESVKFPNLIARSTVASREIFCGYQDRAIGSKSLKIIDPFTGQHNEPVDSCIIYGRASYFYRSKYNFYLITGGEGAKIAGLYAPKLNLVFDFGAAIDTVFSPVFMANWLAAMSQRIAKNRDAYNNSLKVNNGSVNSLIVSVPSVENFAHHIWNYYSAIERYIAGGLSANIDCVVTSGTQFFGPIDNIFPELRGKTRSAVRSPLVDLAPYKSGTLVVKSGGYFITKGLRERVRTAMRQLPPPISSFAASPENFSVRWPTIWIGMRIGDKSWIDQEAGVGFLIKALSNRYPNALFLLDGFSYPVGHDQASVNWLGAINSLNTLATSIKDKAPDPDRVVNMVGNTIRESVLWAERVHLYLSPIGTTQHKIGWFTSAPGIVYSAPRLGNLPPERLPGAWEAEGSIPPHYVFGTPVAQGKRRGVNDRRAYLDNMQLDPKELLEIMTGMLDKARS